jgi:hypothetical protein
VEPLPRSRVTKDGECADDRRQADNGSNTGSRMESEGTPGSIQITASTYELIRDRFTCEPRESFP